MKNIPVESEEDKLKNTESEKIELFEESVVEASSPVALPVNFVAVGTVEHDSVQVYLKQDVYKKIEKFAKEQTSKEVGSILIGNFVEEKNRKTVIISDWIEAKYTDASAATLTFTHETWEYVNREKEQKYGDQKIVGWQHTHPGYGIFLSNYDIFIQENFFNLPWQIAYVVDPIADTRGFFEWKGGKVSKMTGFYVYDEIGKEIKISEKAKPVKKRFSPASLVLAVLLVVSMMIAVSLAIEKSRTQARLNEALTSARQQILQANNDIPPASAREAEPMPQNTESFLIYEVQPGDCLESICMEHQLNYTSNVGKIMKINGITDTDRIYAGQKLYLPMP